MLGHRLRRWPNIVPAQDLRPVFAGIATELYTGQASNLEFNYRTLA